ncbi:MAG: DUF2333 family protein [Desulfosudaceae bacterium]
MSKNNLDSASSDREYTLFAWWRIAAALIGAAAVIWIITVLAGFFSPSSPAAPHQQQPPSAAETMAAPDKTNTETEKLDGRPQTEPDHAPADAAAEEDKSESTPASAEPSASDSSEPGPPKKTRNENVAGLTFTTALVKPLRYELEERFWGWRPNDLIQFTDNVNSMQLGILEVTRRATVSLAERISRTGSTAELDPDLESAMNCLMVKADSFWFPSAERMYAESLREIEKYGHRLTAGQANFYTRTDNLIPLIKSFTDLLGSCDENLVKQKEKDGQPVSTFAADNYFYYAKGVAGAMVPILEAVDEDFHDILVTRGGAEILHRAIHACQVSASLDPLIVLESDLSSLLANHRANMAAHISHARFYLDVLANTLST